MSQIWWLDHSHGKGLVGYMGGTTGLEYRRHAKFCVAGLWRVAVTGWGAVSHAVVDDFGTLVEVPA